MNGTKRLILGVLSIIQVVALLGTGVVLYFLTGETYDSIADLNYRLLASVLISILMLPLLVAVLRVARFALFDSKGENPVQHLTNLLKSCETLLYAQAAWVILVVVLLSVLEDVGHITVLLGVALVVTFFVALALLFSVLREQLERKI